MCLPAAKKSKGEYLPALTGLRFVLAIWVMLHHISGKGMMVETWANSLPAAAAALVHGGYLAVQTFFILSGFVLARSYAKATWTRNDLWRYGAARVARIYPVYLVSLVVVLPFIYQAMLKPGRSAGEKAGILLNYGFVLQGWNGGMGVGWNTPAWSLSCEFFFYLFFPLLLIAFRNAGRLTIAAALAVSLVVPVLLAHSNVPWQWQPVHHLPDFAAGVAASRLFEFLQPSMRRRGQWLYLPAIAAGALLIVHPRIMYATYGDLNTGLRPLNVLALVGLALGGGWVARIFSSMTAQYLGKVSYAMYILHVPVLWWYGYWSVYGPLRLPPTVAAVVYFVLVTGLAALAFEMVEMPANRWIRNRVAARLQERRPVLAEAAAA
ncbi:MAG TPA: acyltransferase [Bryobacteraceae bacterium]|nr:acyltransferase [Bryobacteraceae bacterium]